VATAQASLTKAQDSLTAAHQTFCSQAKDYVTTLDRYGKLFTDSKATVGDVKSAGTDLTAPKESVSSAATAVAKAQADVVSAEKELADAQAALADANAAASSVSASSTTSSTTTTLVPPATIDRVKQAEADLTTTSQGVTDSTPLVQATVAYHSAAFALEVAWLKLVADAGCLTDQRHAKAVTQVTNYTAALQTQLQKAGYYTGPVDAIYGPQTVAAVKQLQTDSGLPTTGVVDRATALALDRKAVAAGQQPAAQPTSQTAAVQTILRLTGYWSGPIDGIWTLELTDALEQFQSALGVEATGVVDAATLAAFEQAIENAKNSPPTTTASPTTTTAGTTTTPPSSTTVSTTISTTTRATTTTAAPTTTT
jgi:peptidoglycan hydrolase-like protein with peptidoglycan-binding domain